MTKPYEAIFDKLRQSEPHLAQFTDDKALALELARLNGREDDADEFVREEYGYEIPRQSLFSQGLAERTLTSTTLGFAPKIGNTVAAMGAAAFGADFDQAYTTMQEWSENRMREYAEDNPKMAMAGDFAGAVAGGVMTGGAVAGLGRGLARGAASEAALALPAASRMGQAADMLGRAGGALQRAPGTMLGQAVMGSGEAATYAANTGGDVSDAAMLGFATPFAARGVLSGIDKLRASRAARAAAEEMAPPPGAPPPGAPPPGAPPPGAPPPGAPPPRPPPPGGGFGNEVMDGIGRSFQKNVQTPGGIAGGAAKAFLDGSMSGGVSAGLMRAGGRLVHAAGRKLSAGAWDIADPALRRAMGLSDEVAAPAGARLSSAHVPTPKTVHWSDAEIADAVALAERQTMPPGANLPRQAPNGPVPPKRLPQSTLSPRSPFDAVEPAVTDAARAAKVEARVRAQPPTPPTPSLWGDALDEMDVVPSRVPDVNLPRGTAPTVERFPSMGAASDELPAAWAPSPAVPVQAPVAAPVISAFDDVKAPASVSDAAAKVRAEIKAGKHPRKKNMQEKAKAKAGREELRLPIHEKVRKEWKDLVASGKAEGLDRGKWMKARMADLIDESKKKAAK